MVGSDLDGEKLAAEQLDHGSRRDAAGLFGLWPKGSGSMQALAGDGRDRPGAAEIYLAKGTVAGDAACS